MNSQAFIIGLIGSAIILYLIWRKVRNQKPKADTDTTRPSQEYLPTSLKPNDKLAMVNDISYTELQSILTGFCNMYNKARYQAQPRVIKLTEREFVITFPFDIEFETFCYFINYLNYPMEFDKSFNVTGWTTTKAGETWITEKSANRKIMLFIPSDDTEHDNVFMTTADNAGFKLGFAMGDERQLLDRPRKQYSPPPIEISELADKEHVDFR